MKTILLYLFLTLILPCFLYGQTFERTIWFAPLPPLPEHAGRPYIGSDDFIGLFAEDADWESAADRVDVFKLYQEWVAYATDDELSDVIADIERRNMSLGIEMSPVTAVDTCGLGLEGFAGLTEGIRITNKIHAAGGTIDYVAFDEPFYYGSLYTGHQACNWSAEKIAEEVYLYVQAVRTVFPDAIFGDIEPLPTDVNTEEYKNWMDTYYKVTGENLAFLHMDLDYKCPSWISDAKDIEHYTQSRGIEYGLIYFGEGDDTSDEQWISHAEERMMQYETEGLGTPDHAIFQSWMDHPDHCLPETSPISFTHLINTYFKKRTKINLSDLFINSYDQLEVSGILLDQDDLIIPNAQIIWSIRPNYAPSALEPFELITHEEVTDVDGTFRITFDNIYPSNISIQVQYNGVEASSSTGDDGLWPAYNQAVNGLPTENLSQISTISSSNSLSTDGPEQAIDLEYESIWNAGDDPPQWIELNLEKPMTIWQIRLAIAQDPSGFTQHMVWGKGPDASDTYQLLHEFDDITNDQEVLNYVRDVPLLNIRFIKIETLASPSWVAWREIDIIPWNNFILSSNEELPIEESFTTINIFPNPISTSTTIEYNLLKSELIKIKIFDSFGQLVDIVFDGYQSEGRHQIIWNGKDSKGHFLNAGIYYCRLNSPNAFQTLQMVIIK